MSLEVSGMTFCVVCGRFDRELVLRKSGLKCLDCVGRRSKRDYAVLQQQQATFMLLSMSPSHRSAASRDVTSPFAASASGPSSHGSPRTGPCATVAVEEVPSLPVNDLRRVRVNLNEIVTTVETPTTVMVDADRVTIPLIGTSIKAQQSIVLYNFVTRRRYCPHETIATSLPGSSLSFSLMCPSCSRPLSQRRHRFSHAVSIFQQLKAVAGDSLPPLPPRKLLARFSSDFLEQRRCAMEAFVQGAVSSSFFVRHPQLLELLGLDEDRHGGFEDDDNDLVPAPESNTAPLELSATTLQQWRRGALIGKGAFGSVYLGLLPSTSQLVAVKVVKLNAADNPDVDALQSELAMLRTLFHPNIVQLLGALKTRQGQETELCIFTEYVECGSVARMVRKFGALPFPVIQRYLRQVLLGLSFLHEKGVVHRDIKGDNILVSKEGAIKLADFGCSAQLQRLAEVDDEPVTGGVIANLAGTPLWMSPEAMRGEQLGTSTDMWSVGCVGIELLGRPPWNMNKGENVFTAMFRFQKAQHFPDGFPKDSEGCPNSYRDFLSCCLQRAEADRPTAQQLLLHPFFLEDFVLVDDEPLDMASPLAASSRSAELPDVVL
jgi:serine/threonine protein kinase